MNSFKKIILMMFALGCFCVLAYNLIWSPQWQIQRWPETRLRAIYIEASVKQVLNTHDQRQQLIVDAVKARDPQIEDSLFNRVLICSALTVILTAALNMIPLLGSIRNDGRIRGAQLITAMQLKKMILTRSVRKTLCWLGLYVVLSLALGLLVFVKFRLISALVLAAPLGVALYFLAEYLSKGTLKSRKKIMIGGVPIPPELEGRHFIISGTTGAGKSQAIYKMLIDARARGDRALIMDIGGAYHKRFYRRGDVLLAPGDSDSVKWSPFC